MDRALTLLPESSAECRVYAERWHGCSAALFLIPVLVFGAIAAVMWNSSRTFGSPASDALYPLAATVPFLCLALAFWSYRRRMALDRQRAELRFEYQLLGLRWQRSRALQGCTFIQLSKVRRSTGKSSYDAFPVALAGPGVSHAFYESACETDCRALALELARFLHWPLHDTVGGAQTVFSPAELERDLREHLRDEARAAQPAPPPAGSLLRCEPLPGTAGGVRIHVPPYRPGAGFWAFALGLAVAATVFWVFSGIPAWHDPKMPWGAALGLNLIVGGLLTLPAVLLLQFCLRSPRLWRTVEASPAGLRVREFGFVAHAVEDLAAADLEDLRIEQHAGGTQLAWIGAQRNHRMCEGLAAGEHAWLRRELLRALFTPH